jgi:hypothetical protein
MPTVAQFVAAADSYFANGMDAARAADIYAKGCTALKRGKDCRRRNIRRAEWTKEPLCPHCAVMATI